MIDTQKAQALYNGIANDYDLGDFDTFVTKLEDVNKRKALYDAVSKEYDVGETFEDFDAKLYVPQETIVSPEKKPVTVSPLAGFNDIISSTYYGTARFFEGLDNLAWYAGKIMKDPRAEQNITDATGRKVKPFGPFGAIAEDQRRWGRLFAKKGLPSDAGKAYSLMKSVYSGLGSAAMDISFITAFGLPQYLALTKTGEAAGMGEEGKQLAKAAGEGLAEGALMHGIFKGLGAFKPGTRVSASSMLFSGQQMIHELQKPPEERDWEAVFASGVVGGALAGLDASKGRSFKEIARDALGQTKFKKGVKQVKEAAKIVEEDRMVAAADLELSRAMANEALSTVEKTAAAEQVRQQFREMNYTKYAFDKARAEELNRALDIAIQENPVYRRARDLPDPEYVGPSAKGYAALKEDLAVRETWPFRGKVRKPEPVDPRDPNVLMERDLGPAKVHRERMDEAVYERARKAGLVEVPETKPIITDPRAVKEPRRPRSKQVPGDKQAALYDVKASNGLPYERLVIKHGKGPVDALIDEGALTVRRRGGKVTVFAAPEAKVKNLLAEDIIDIKPIITNLSNALGHTVRGSIEAAGGRRVGVLPYSEYNYQQARPHFQKAWEAYKAAGQSFARFVEEMATKYGEQVLPYLRQLEKENGNPVTKSTPYGKVTAPRGETLTISNVPKTHALPLDSYKVARKVTLARNKKAARLRAKYGDDIPTDKLKKLKAMEVKWDDMHPAHRAAMKEKVDRMQQGVEPVTPEYRAIMERLARNRIDDSYMSGETKPDDIVIQRTNPETGLKRPPVTARDLDALRELSQKDIPKSFTGWNFTSMIHLFNRMGKNIKEMFLHPHSEADHKKVQLVRAVRTQETAEIKKYKASGELTKGWQRRVGAYGVATRNEHGRAVLEQYGVKVPTWEELSTGEKAMYEFYRNKFDQLLPLINKARTAAGEAPIPKSADYVPFIRMIAEWEAQGGNPLSKPISVDYNPYAQKSITPFPFEKQLTESDINIQTDIQYGFQRYLDIASEHIFRSPVIAKQRELLKRLEDTRGNKVLDLREDAPNAFNEITEYVDFMSGKRKPPTFSREFEKALYKLNANIGMAVMSFNLRSTVIQPSAYGGTIHKVGLESALHGITALKSKESIKDIIRKSRVLDSRFYDVFISDLSETLSSKISNRRDVVAKTGLSLLTGLDMLTAVATWESGYYFAKNKRGISETAALRFADDLVLETQASASRSQRAKIQRSAVGKALTLFGTFNINQFSYVRSEVIGLGKPEMTPQERAYSIVRWAMITGLTNAAFQAVGIRPPFPSPLGSAIDELREGESALTAAGAAVGEFAEYVPVLGGTRYSEGLFGASGQTVSETMQLMISGKGGIPKAVQVTGKWVGIPGTQQLYKTYWMAKSGEPVVKSSLAPKAKKATKRKSSTRKSKSKRRGSPNRTTR